MCTLCGDPAHVQPGSPEWEERAETLLHEEIAHGSLAWYWLSFVDPEKPKGTRFLGVVILQAKGILDATTTAHRLSINPGGEVLSSPLQFAPPERFRYRLLSREDLTQLNTQDPRFHVDL